MALPDIPSLSSAAAIALKSKEIVYVMLVKYHTCKDGTSICTVTDLSGLAANEDNKKCVNGAVTWEFVLAQWKST